MSDPLLDRHVRHRLAVLRHAEEVTGNVALTCRYFGISRQLSPNLLRRRLGDARHLSNRASLRPITTRQRLVRPGSTQPHR